MLVQTVLLNISHSLLESLRAGETEVRQGFLVPLEVVIDPEALIIVLQRAQLPQER